LAEIENRIMQLQLEYETATNNLNDLRYQMQLVELRINRSGRLTSALIDEQIRWEQLIKVIPNYYYLKTAIVLIIYLFLLLFIE
jgi:hypothetical protein